MTTLLVRVYLNTPWSFIFALRNVLTLAMYKLKITLQCLLDACHFLWRYLLSGNMVVSKAGALLSGQQGEGLYTE